MTDVEPLPERVDRIERKLDAVSESVDRRFAGVNTRFDQVDKRFDEVSEHFVEQRQYTEFAFDKLRNEMVEGFTRLERKLDSNSRGLKRFESKFDRFMEDQARPPRPRRSRRVPKKR